MAKILIVDDSSIDRRILCRLLAHQGYEVFEAENGEEAVRSYPVVRPDLVLMDYQMVKMGGIPALRKIIKMDAAARVVMVSASPDRTTVDEAIRYGAVDYVIKPIEPDELMAIIGRALEDPQ